MSACSRCATTTALAALVSLLVHQVAYLIAFPTASVRADRLADHGHLATQWAIVTPLAVVALAVFILRQVRLLGIASDIGRTGLAATAAALFLGQESIEAYLGSGSPTALFDNRAALLGVLLVPLVATLVAYALRGAARLARSLVARPRVRRRRTAALRPARDEAHPGARVFGSWSPRGPPLVPGL